MRRKDREITDHAEMESLLHNAVVCHLACADNNVPYVVPLCYGYMNKVLYIHSGKGGKKIECLKKNPSCCVEVDLVEDVKKAESPCKWEMRYKSVICTGKARFVDNAQEKRIALACIINHYGCRSYEFSEPELASVCIIRIDIEDMTGKKYGCDKPHQS